MKLRCAIAASNRDDPGQSLAYLLESRDCPIDFNDGAFDRIASFFRGLTASLVTTG